MAPQLIDRILIGLPGKGLRITASTLPMGERNMNQSSFKADKLFNRLVTISPNFHIKWN